MSKLVEIIALKKPNIIGKVKPQEIIEAEEKLKINFSDQYREFLSEYGAVSYSSNEVFGLGTNSYMNIVKTTLEERKNSNGLLDDYVVLQNIGIGSYLIIMNEKGEIFEFNGKNNKKIYESFYEYLEKEVLK